MPHTYGYFDQNYGLTNEVGLAIAESTAAAKTVGWPCPAGSDPPPWTPWCPRSPMGPNGTLWGWRTKPPPRNWQDREPVSVLPGKLSGLLVLADLLVSEVCHDLWKLRPEFAICLRHLSSVICLSSSSVNHVVGWRLSESYLRS